MRHRFGFLAVGAIGLAIAARMMHRQGARATMHSDDWVDGGVPLHGRRYRSLSHLMHHARELLAMTWTLARIYLLRALTPAFREQIMIVTATANGCPP